MKNNRKYNFSVLRCVLILFCVTLLSGQLLNGLLAKFTTGATPETNQARISVWNVSAVMPTMNKIDMDMDDEYSDDDTGYYSFTVLSSGSEVAGVYGIVVTFKDWNNLTVWPEGITVMITDESGSNILGENTTGVFSEIGSFLPGETSSVTYRLYLKANVDTAIGNYSVEISAVIEQTV